MVALDVKHIAAHRRPGQAGGHARGNSRSMVVLAELRPWPSNSVEQILRTDRDAARYPPFAKEPPPYGRAAPIAPVQFANTRLTRVIAESRCSSVSSGIVSCSSVRAPGLLSCREQILTRDLSASRRACTRQSQHFHPIQKRRGIVSSVFAVVMKNTRDRSNGRVQIIVVGIRCSAPDRESPSGRMRVTTEVTADLVNLVQHDQRVPDPARRMA